MKNRKTVWSMLAAGLLFPVLSTIAWGGMVPTPFRIGIVSQARGQTAQINLYLGVPPDPVVPGSPAIPCVMELRCF